MPGKNKKSNATSKGNAPKQQQAKKPQKAPKRRAKAATVRKDFSFADSASNIGSSLGGAIGRVGGAFLSRLTGFGAYEVSKNSVSDGNAIPSFYNDGDGVVVCHREYLSDISGSLAFTLASLSINPGLAATFPWLSSVANQFEEYEMLGLVFEFRPLSGMAVSTTSASLGVVVYATDYNPYNPLFSTKQQMESYEYSTSTVPFQQMLHPVECKPGSDVLRKKFIRGGAVTNGTLQLYDVGTFQFATSGMQSAYVVGELWVSYHVRLSKPRIDLTPICGSAHFVESPAGTATAALGSGTGGALQRFSTIPSVISLGTTDSGVYLASPGYYCVLLSYVPTAGVITTAPTWFMGTNIVTAGNIWANNAQFGNSGYNGAASTAFSARTIIVTSKAATHLATTNWLTWSGPTTMTAGSMDFWIFPLPYQPT